MASQDLFNPTSNQKGKLVKHGGHGKLFVMLVFLALDLGLNSSLDYDTYNETKSDIFRLGLFGLQIIVQITVFLLLFLTIADTFLFRVGLLNILLRKVRMMLIIICVYFILTVVVGSMRLEHFRSSGSQDNDDTYTIHSSPTTTTTSSSSSTSSASEDPTLLSLITNKSFITVSLLQKFVAVVYYVVNMYTIVKLEDPIFFNKDAWIALIKENRKE